VLPPVFEEPTLPAPASQLEVGRGFAVPFEDVLVFLLHPGSGLDLVDLVLQNHRIPLGVDHDDVIPFLPDLSVEFAAVLEHDLVGQGSGGEEEAEGEGKNTEAHGSSPIGNRGGFLGIVTDTPFPGLPFPAFFFLTVRLK
jgi:hypothetical protein